MTKLEKLHQTAFDENIAVNDFSFSAEKKSMCMYHNGFKTIALNKSAISSPAEETTVLAEEVGHFKTNALYPVGTTANAPLAKANRLKAEAKAKRWAVEQYLPAAEIQKALNAACADDSEIAEYCGVTVEFVQKAFQLYK